MRYLIDTNILIWFLKKDPNLPNGFRDIMFDPQNTIVVSIASLWEIGIKYSLHKIILHKPFDFFIEEIQQTDFIEFLEIKPAHIIKQALLPFHHRDPFDRLIYAQAVQ